MAGAVVACIVAPLWRLSCRVIACIVAPLWRASWRYTYSVYSGAAIACIVAPRDTVSRVSHAARVCIGALLSIVKKRTQTQVSAGFVFHATLTPLKSTGGFAQRPRS